MPSSKKKPEEEGGEVPPPPSPSVRVSRELPRMARDLHLHDPRGRELTVAVYADFYPVAYRRLVPKPKPKAAAAAAAAKKRGGGREWRYMGLDVDLMERFCAASGLPRPRFVRARGFFDAWQLPADWNNTSTRRVDVAIGGIGRSRFRSDDAGVEWTMPYFRVRRTVVYRLADPIRRFPQDVTGVVAGTMGTTGMSDAFRRFLRYRRDDDMHAHLDARGDSSDQKDLRDLRAGRLQGLMRGSFVGAALVAAHPDELGMAEPWDADPAVVGPGGEVFAFPCRRGSGLAAQLNAFLARAVHSGELRELVARHGMATDNI